MSDEERERLAKLAREITQDLTADGQPVEDETEDEFLQVLDALRAPSLDAAPTDWKAEAIGYLTADQSDPATVSRWIGSLTEHLQEAGDQLRGILIFDTSLDAALPGLRGTDTSPTRHVLYGNAEGRLHLQLAERDGRIELRGQFLATISSVTPTIRTVEITADEIPETKTDLDEDGQFLIADLSPGIWDLKVRWGELALLLGPIRV